MFRFKISNLEFLFLVVPMEQKYVVAVLRNDMIFKLQNIGFFKPAAKKFMRKIHHALCYLRVWPVYFATWSRDCDCVESTNAHRFPTYYHAMRVLNHPDNWDEGPFQYWRISKNDYLAFRPELRDRILEAFEDGRGTHVNI